MFEFSRDLYYILWIAEIPLVMILCCILYIKNKIDREWFAINMVFTVMGPAFICLGVIGWISVNVWDKIEVLRIKNLSIQQNKELEELQRLQEREEKEKQLQQDYEDVINMIYTP